MSHPAHPARRPSRGRPSRGPLGPSRSGRARTAAGTLTRAKPARGTTPRPTARTASRRLGAAARWLAGNAVFALLALATLAVLAALGLAARGAPATAATTPAGPPPPAWIPLRSQSPADIRAAVRASPLFHVNRSGPGDHLRDVSRLGVPVLVTELLPSGGGPSQDAYAVPILDAHGGTAGVAVAWLTADRSAVYVGYIRSYDVSVPTWPYALPGSGRVVAAVAAHAGAAWRPGGAPRLVYFPVAPAGTPGAPSWRGGGEGPDDPVWLVPGVGGADRVLGTDGQIYPLTALPFASPA